jgi:hypothetical protein
MQEPILVTDPHAVPALPAAERAAQAALSLLLADNRSGETRRAYQADLRDFFAWRGQETGRDAVAALCSLDAGGLALLLSDLLKEER